MSFIEMGILEMNDCITSIDYSPAGDLVAVGCIDETVQVW